MVLAEQNWHNSEMDELETSRAINSARVNDGAGTQMQSFTVHVRSGGAFEDLVIKARSVEEAIAEAKRITTIPNKSWARYVV